MDSLLQEIGKFPAHCAPALLFLGSHKQNLLDWCWIVKTETSILFIDSNLPISNMISVWVVCSHDYKHVLKLWTDGFWCERLGTRFLKDQGDNVVPDVTFTQQLKIKNIPTLGIHLVIIVYNKWRPFLDSESTHPSAFQSLSTRVKLGWFPYMARA